MALLMGVGISYAQNDTEEVVEVPSDSMQVAVMQDKKKFLGMPILFRLPKQLSIRLLSLV